MKSPAILYFQETKFKRAGTYKIDGSIVYEHLRSEKPSRGGILMEVKKYINPGMGVGEKLKHQHLILLFRPVITRFLKFFISIILILC